MTQPTNIPICILAGGASRRFGRDKAVAKLGGKPLVEHVLDRLRGQTSGPIAINTEHCDTYAQYDLTLIQDAAWQGAGPLAGVCSAVEWASREGFETVVTLAVDLPFLPLDLIEKLNAAGPSSFAATKGQWHPVNGLWRIDQRALLKNYLQSGKRSAHGWAEHCEAAPVLFENNPEGTDPFWNINTPQDLAAAERYIASA